MRRFLRAGCFPTVATILLLAVSSAAAHKSSRIETRRGEVYLGCDFKVNNMYKVLELSCSDGNRNIGFPDVAHIYDEDGYDVTEDYLGKYYRPDSTAAAPPPAPVDSGGPVKQSADTGTVAPTEGATQPGQSTWLEETDRKKREKRRTRPLEGSIVLYPSYSAPLGSYYDGLTAGVGFGGEVTIAVSREYALRFSVERQGVRVDSAEFVQLSRAMGVALISHDVTVTMMRYVVSFEYHGWPHQERGGGFWWFASSGIGAINHTFSGDALAIDPQTLEPAYYRTDYSETKFIGTAAMGIVPMLSKNLGLECSFNWDLVFVGTVDDNSTYANEVQMASVIDLRVGLTYIFR